MKNTDQIKQVKETINEISPTFCIAKWHMTTIYLQTGETHSCYHPPPHKIPIEGLEENPSSLHNTPEKKQQRLEMLNGNKPSGCQYCWNIEALGSDYISDRHERNWNEFLYNRERLPEFKNIKWDANINPDYIEISFGHECNFKCGYCHPKASSSYYKEIETFGPYKNVTNHNNDIDWFKIYHKEEENPYVKAWWDWWPEVKKTLYTLRITGGEPLLQQSTWRLIEDLDKNPAPNLGININSNFGIKPVLVERLTQKIRKLVDEKKIKKFKVFTSIDTWGERAEYIRTGLDLQLWEKNLDSYMTIGNFPITFMITFNALSVTSFKTLLEKILEWREKYNAGNYINQVNFDTPYLKEPLQFDMNILPKEEFMPYMYDSLRFIEENCEEKNKNKFTELELEKFRRVVKYMETTNYSEEKVREGRHDFYHWFKEYDRRRSTDFLKTFPEMTNFYQKCSEL